MVHPCADAGRGHLLSSVADCHPRARTCNLPVVGVWHRSQAGGLLSPLCVLAHGMDLLRIPGRATESLDGRERNGAGSRPASVWHEQECSFRTPFVLCVTHLLSMQRPCWLAWSAASGDGTGIVSRVLPGPWAASGSRADRRATGLTLRLVSGEPAPDSGEPVPDSGEWGLDRYEPGARGGLGRADAVFGPVAMAQAVRRGGFFLRAETTRKHLISDLKTHFSASASRQ